MRDSCQHHLHALVPRAQGDSHLVESARQIADLVAGFDSDRSRQIAVTDALGCQGQALERARHAPREPCRQKNDECQAGHAACQKPAPKRRQRVQILCARLDDGKAGIADARIAALVRQAITANEKRRRGRLPRRCFFQLRRVCTELVGLRTQG